MLQNDGKICGIAWSPDGQILTVATKAGCVFNFLARMPTVHGAHCSDVAYLSSLREITVIAGQPATGVRTHLRKTLTA